MGGDSGVGMGDKKRQVEAIGRDKGQTQGDKGGNGEEQQFGNWRQGPF